MQILDDLFGRVAQAAEILGVDPDFKARVLEARAKLAPMQIGRKGNLQEWLEDWDETEKSHRHISGLWGLFPGHQISRAPDAGVRRGQQGRPGAARTARATAGPRPGRRPAGPASGTAPRPWRTSPTPCTTTRRRACSRSARGAMQVDGAFGMSAAVAEMLLQSHEDEIWLPAGPAGILDGRARSRASCARGGFEVGLRWKDGRLDGGDAPVEERPVLPGALRRSPEGRPSGAGPCPSAARNRASSSSRPSRERRIR